MTRIWRVTLVVHDGDTLHICATYAHFSMRGGTETVRIFVDVHNQELRHFVDPMLLFRLLAATGLALKVLDTRHRQGRLDGDFCVSTWLRAEDALCLAFLIGIRAAIT
jgi:hypothetical protein